MVFFWSFLVGMAAADEAAEKPSIEFEAYELDNGLNVILSEDHSSPIVQVNIWYDVGSKDELPGKTGFAHLFEHLMFQGSLHFDDDYFVPLQAIGARVNGTTNFDRTNYFEGVSSEYLPLALWMESDRMGYLLEALSEDKLTNQKDVVRNERRQRYEVPPYGEVRPWLFENLYPEGHPYHVTTIGKHEDLEAATMDDVRAFFKKWYVPNNATLTVCGDFNPDEAKTLIDNYFGEIPRGEDVQSLQTADHQLTEEKIIRKEKKVPEDKVWIAWITPALYANGDADLDIFSTLIADGNDSILTKALVFDQRIAKSVVAYQSSSRLQSIYLMELTAAKGHTTDELVEAADAVLEQFKSDGANAENVEIAKNNWESNFYWGLLNISGKANMLSSYNTLTGDPGFMNKDIQRYLDVTADTVNSTVQKYLGSNRVVLHVNAPKAEE
ncbi:MAG: M16 family metallopeptidase [Myxococcota bacterium]